MKRASAKRKATAATAAPKLKKPLIEYQQDAQTTDVEKTKSKKPSTSTKLPKSTKKTSKTTKESAQRRSISEGGTRVTREARRSNKEARQSEQLPEGGNSERIRSLALAGTRPREEVGS